MAMSLGSLSAIALVFVLGVIVISIGADVIDEVQDTQTSNSYAYNVSGDGLEGMETLGDWLPTIATIAGAAIIITVIAKGFGR